MARMSNRTARIVKWAALPAALIVSGVVVSQASYSAFTATTTNSANNWNSGQLTLTNSSPATALFAVNNIKPGDWGSKCITVTAPNVVSGTTVTMNAKTTGGKSELNSQLGLKVTPGATCTPTTTPITFAAGSTVGTFITGNTVPTWSPATNGATNSYLIEWVFDPAATTEVSGGKSTNIDFNWVANQGSAQQVPAVTP